MTDEQFHELFKMYVGAISAVLGMVTTVVVQYIFKTYIGNLKITLDEPKNTYMYYETTSGNLCQTKDIEQATRAKITCQIYIYSSKEIPVSLRNIHIKVSENKKDVTFNLEVNKAKKLKVLNIPPKNMMNYSIEFEVLKHEWENVLKENNKIYFMAIKENEKEVKAIVPVEFK